MGKNADNERLKLKAAFYNNLASGTVLAGVVLPIIGVFLSNDWRQGEVIYIPFAKVLIVIIGLSVAIATAATLREIANAALRSIQD